MSGEVTYRLALDHAGVWTLAADGELLDALHGHEDVDQDDVLDWATETVRSLRSATVQSWAPAYAAGDQPEYSAVVPDGDANGQDRDEKRRRYLADFDPTHESGRRSATPFDIHRLDISDADYGGPGSVNRT